MCGIVGYLGDKSAKDVIIKGLKRLEYRGYDSAGIATMESQKLTISKTSGKVADLISSLNDDDHQGNMGIGHTGGLHMANPIMTMPIPTVITAESLPLFTMALSKIITA